AEGPADAAAANTTSLTAAAWSAFGRAETGWEIYAPRAAAEIGAPACAPTSPGFAAALAGWQGSHGLGKSGIMDEPTLAAMKNTWAMQRPFVLVNKKGVCPDAPPEVALETTTAADTYGSPLKLRTGALAAWRRLMSDARAEVPSIAADPNLLKIMSGYRDPVSDAVRCVTEMNCQNITRSTCSAHRTGLAVDVYLGSAPGFDPASSEDVNRLFQSRGPAYRWLVANAGRYGFVNYAFEPWHWEWTGEPVVWQATN
ncbi:MAG: peptidase, partial [Caulobacter sp.]|nr:peptidase [Caulobacter sp.]